MTVTVLQLSDIHLTAQAGGPVLGVDPDARLADVLAAWVDLGEAADLVVLSGDNTDDGTFDAYRRLADAVSTLGAPILAVPGNHDVPSRVADAFGGATSTEAGAWRVVGLDTSLPGEIHGRVNVRDMNEQLDRFDRRPTLVVAHHPPVSRSTHSWFQLEGGDELLAALARKPQVRALISGHLHDPFELEGPGGLALLGCPSTLAAIEHDGDRYEVRHDGSTGARVLRLEDDGTLSSMLLTA